MAWAKTKKAVVITAIVILAAGGTSFVGFEIFHAIRAAHYPNIEGAWEGVMPFGGPTSSRVVVKVSKKDGDYVAYFDLIDMGRTNYPISKVVYNFPDIELIANPRRNMVYQGKMNKSATKMDFGPVVLRKTQSPPTYTPLEEDDFAPRPDSNLQGFWTGTVAGTDPSNEMPLNLKIAGEPDGTYRAEFDNPMMGADGQPASVTLSQGRIKLALNSHDGRLSLVMDESGQQMSGAWVHDSQSSKVIFKRGNYLTELMRQEDENFSSSSPSDLQGHWKGSWDVTLGTIKVNIPMELDIAKMSDGTYSATIANLDQLGQDSPAPASSFEFSPPNVHAEWKWQKVSYTGQLENGQIVGTWSEGGGGFKLDFDRMKD